jgi:photosystem II stability/assembly factor-like uncharacterized protein
LNIKLKIMKTIFRLFLIILPSLLIFGSCTKKKQEERERKQEGNDWFINQRIFPNGRVDYEAYRNAVNYVNSERGKLRTANMLNNWQYAGPENIGGRITDVEMHASSLQVMYLCAASGGIFKSINAGVSWLPVFDAQPTLSIGDLAIAPSDANTLYAGTGEANAGGGSITYDGMGVYKSGDAGSTWNYIGLDSTRNTGRIAINPFNKDIVYVAAMGDLFGNTTQRGIYKTTDGGISWQQSLFLNDSTGGIDVVVHPQHPDTVFVCMWTRVRRPERRNYGGPASGIYRSYDGGISWTKLTNGLSFAGIPGRIGIDISQTNPNILFATVTDDSGANIGIYKTIDNGDTWTTVTQPAASGYSYWFGRIKIDPTDPATVYFIDFDLHKSTNGGQTWNAMASFTHADQHEVYIHPLNHNLVLLGNDGGFYISNNGGTTWTHDVTLPITQFYTCEMDEQNPALLYGGAQDNGVNTTPTGNFNDWTMIWSGDGMVVLVDPNDPLKVYMEGQYGFLNTALNGIGPADRFNWNTPIIFNPVNSNSLFLGTSKVYKTTNRGMNWNLISPDLTNNTGVAWSYPIVYETITTIDNSAADTAVIYAGTDDGHVWITTNTGLNWTDISSGLPVRWVTRIAADPFDPMGAYVALSGYRYHEAMSHIYHTINGGQSWADIGGNLPDVPVNDVVIDTVNNALYLATDAGVFYTYQGSTSWQVLGAALPSVPVTDLRIHYPTMTLLAATYGRSMYKYDLSTLTAIATIQPWKDKITMRLYPNPFKDHALIQLGLAEELNGKLSVYDLNGQEIETISKGSFKKGMNNIRLALNNNTQGKFRNGIIFVRFVSSSGTSISLKGICAD